MEPLTEEEVRVLGCLIEKEATVPDAYPLTLNALRQACNQTSNRDPIVSYDDLTLQRSLDALKSTGYVRFVHPSHGERTTKFRHVVGEKLALEAPELAVLSVLALRGPQTTAELRTRAERQHAFGSVAEVDAVLAKLAAREEPLVLELPRIPGQHQLRWTHLLAGAVDLDAIAALLAGRPAGGAGSGSPVAAERIVALEAQVNELATRLSRLEEALGVEPPTEN